MSTFAFVSTKGRDNDFIFYFLKRKYHTVAPTAIDTMAKDKITIPTTTPALDFCFILPSAFFVVLTEGFFFFFVIDVWIGVCVVVVGMGGDPGNPH